MNKLTIGKLYYIPDNMLIEHYWKTEFSRENKVSDAKILLLVSKIRYSKEILRYMFVVNNKIIHYYILSNDYIKFEDQFNLLEIKI